MIRELTCIECPTGCIIRAMVEGGKVSGIEGHGCRRGRDYAISEIENPVRVLTTTVPARGLVLRMVPVRTVQPIPQARIQEAMGLIRRLRIDQPVVAGEVVLADLLGLGVDVVATRDAPSGTLPDV